jgi:hypothetical protein
MERELAPDDALRLDAPRELSIWVCRPEPEPYPPKASPPEPPPRLPLPP